MATRTRSFVVCALVLAMVRTASAAIAPAALFRTRCASCHTFGNGTLVGPDLKGVTDRHPRPWLRTWIRSSERLIQSGDKSAQELFRRFKRERMPDQALSDEDIDALLDFLASGGPADDARTHVRHAATATTAEIEHGRALFSGDVPLARGGAPCAACHSAGGDHEFGRATLGRDLTHVYARYQDAALAAFLEHPCFPRVPGLDGAAPMTEDEAFAVRAFLRHVDAVATALRDKGGSR